MSEILQITKEGTLKTQIMYKANLSFTQLNDYLLFMQNNNLITQTYSEGKEVYVITIKGLDFLQIHRELSGMLSRVSAKKHRGFQQSILIQKTQR
jgi:predicted transcriptional regulator